jgi:hypothetical protein
VIEFVALPGVVIGLVGFVAAFVLVAVTRARPAIGMTVLVFWPCSWSPPRCCS